MADFHEEILRLGGLVTSRYAETARLDWKLGVNRAISSAMRDAPKDITSEGLRNVLESSVSKVPGIRSDDYAKKQIEEAVSVLEQGRASEAAEIILDEIRYRKEKAFSSFMLGDTALKDVNQTVEDIFKGGETVMNAARLAAEKRDARSQAVMYSLALMDPNEASLLIKDEYKNVLAPQHLKEILRINEGKIRKAEEIFKKNNPETLSNSVMNNSVKNIQEYTVKAAASGAKFFNPASLYADLQSIRSMSIEELEKEISDNGPAAKLAAKRLDFVRRDAPRNVVDFAYNSGLDLKPLDFGSSDAFLDRAGEASFYAKRFGTEVSSLLTEEERSQIKSLFQEGRAAAQLGILKAMSVLNYPDTVRAVKKDLSSFSSTAIAKAFIAEVNGRNAVSSIIAIDRGEASKDSSRNALYGYSAARKYINEAFMEIGPEVQESIANALSYHARATAGDFGSSMKEMFGADVAIIAGKYISGGKYSESFSDKLFGNYASGSFSPYSGLPAPSILLPPGMSAKEARVSYRNKVAKYLEDGTIPKEQSGITITPDLLYTVAYPVTLDINAYGIMVPSINGTPVPVVDKNNRRLIISLDYGN